MARQSSDDEASTYGADSRRTRAAEPPKTRLRGLSLRKKSLRFKTDRKVPSTTALPATEVIIINSDSDEEMEGAGGVPLESCGAGVAGVVMGHDPAISVRDQFISDQMSRKSGRTALPQGVGSSARPPKRRFFLDHVASTFHFHFLWILNFSLRSPELDGCSSECLCMTLALTHSEISLVGHSYALRSSNHGPSASTIHSIKGSHQDHLLLVPLEGSGTVYLLARNFWPCFDRNIHPQHHNNYFCTSIHLFEIPYIKLVPTSTLL